VQLACLLKALPLLLLGDACRDENRLQQGASGQQQSLDDLPVRRRAQLLLELPERAKDEATHHCHRNRQGHWQLHREYLVACYHFHQHLLRGRWQPWQGHFLSNPWLNSFGPGGLGRLARTVDVLKLKMLQGGATLSWELGEFQQPLAGRNLSRSLLLNQRQAQVPARNLCLT
jgi:hypothetical protein